MRGSGTEIRGFDPNTGRELEPAYRHGDRSHVEAACAAAAAAFGDYRNASAERRAQFLDTIADNIDAISDQLVDRGHAETGLPQARLAGEVGRTSGQLRMFAGVIREGSWNEARIDPPSPIASRCHVPTFGSAVFRWGPSWCSAQVTSPSRSRWPGATPRPPWPPAAPSS